MAWYAGWYCTLTDHGRFFSLTISMRLPVSTFLVDVSTEFSSSSTYSELTSSRRRWRSYTSVAPEEDSHLYAEADFQGRGLVLVGPLRGSDHVLHATFAKYTKTSVIIMERGQTNAMTYLLYQLRSRHRATPCDI